MFRTFVREKTKTYILCSIISYPKSRRLWDTWKNIIEPSRQKMTIWRMRIAFWLLTVTTTSHSRCVILTPFPLQQWLHECYVIRTLPVLSSPKQCVYCAVRYESFMCYSVLFGSHYSSGRSRDRPSQHKDPSVMCDNQHMHSVKYKS